LDNPSVTARGPRPDRASKRWAESEDRVWSEREFWKRAVVELDPRWRPGEPPRVVVSDSMPRSSKYNFATGRHVSRTMSHTLSHPISTAIRSAAVRRALETELAPVLDRLRARAAALVEAELMNRMLNT